MIKISVWEWQTGDELEGTHSQSRAHSPLLSKEPVGDAHIPCMRFHVRYATCLFTYHSIEVSFPSLFSAFKFSIQYQKAGSWHGNEASMELTYVRGFPRPE